MDIKKTLGIGALLVSATGCIVGVGSYNTLYPGTLALSVSPADPYFTEFETINGQRFVGACYNSFANPEVVLRGLVDVMCSHPVSNFGSAGFPSYTADVFQDRMVDSYAQWTGDQYRYMDCDLYQYDAFGSLVDTGLVAFDADVFFEAGFVFETDCDGYRSAMADETVLRMKKIVDGTALPEARMVENTSDEGETTKTTVAKDKADRKNPRMSVSQVKEALEKFRAKFKTKLEENDAVVEEQKELSAE